VRRKSQEADKRMRFYASLSLGFGFRYKACIA